MTLCSHTWELAKRKNNFSAWVRKQLDDEDKKRSSDREEEQEFHSYCKKCDITYSHRLKFMIEYKYCEKCYEKCEMIV